MNARHLVAAIVVVGSSLALLHCSGATDATPEAPDSSADGSLNVPGDGDGGVAEDALVVPPPLADSAPPASPDTACSAAGATHKTCATCCTTNHPSGATVLTTATYACACKADECMTQCSTTACAATPAMPDAACKACIETTLAKNSDGGAPPGSADAGTCIKSVNKACSADTDCAALEACKATCPKQ